jgi:hypothetical protein
MKLLHLFTAAMTAFKELQRSNVYDVGCPLWAVSCKAYDAATANSFAPTR